MQHGPGAILEGAIGSCRDPTVANETSRVATGDLGPGRMPTDM